MTRARCTRTPSVEALHDGRLEGKDRDSIARHLETCEECARASARASAMTEALRGLPVPERSELEVRRARAEMLARALTGDVEAPSSGRFTPSRAVLLATALVVLALVVGLRREAPRVASGPAVARAPAASAPSPRALEDVAIPRFEVVEVGQADVVTERVGALVRANLRSGTASFHVEHLAPGARFVVRVPDGEVEVRGTRFVVEVADGTTRSVVVTEGVVAVRIAGRAVDVRAGERWDAPPTSMAPAGSSAPAHAVAPVPVDAPTSTPPPTAPSAAPPTAGTRFADAMRAYSAGDYGLAERRFADFVRAFPADARVEDAMFLVADARARRGDEAGAREAARAYLARYPSGLRAPVAERLAHP